MESQIGLERVGVRGREEPFLKRFSLPRIQDFSDFCNSIWLRYNMDMILQLTEKI